MRSLILTVLLAIPTTNVFAQQSAFRVCMEAEAGEAKYAPISAKLALSGGREATTFAMLTDQTMASDSEKPAIAAWADLYARCFRHDAPYLKAIPPDAADLIDASVSALISLAAKLYIGELTYGQFNNQRSEMGQRLRTGLASIQQREQSRVQAAANADYEARRQMAIQFLLGQQANQRSAPVQPFQMQVPAPAVITNCFRFGTQTTCTTH